MALQSSDRSSPITIRDVAREAGVSVTAASRALNDKAELSVEKRAAVLAAAQRLCYTPNSVARALVSGRSRTLGVLVSNNTSPVYAHVFQGIEEVALRENYGVLLANSAWSQEQALHCLGVFRANQVAGLLLTPVQTDRRDIHLLEQAGIPYVLVLRYFDDLPGDGVRVDNRCGGFLVTDHLLQLGHRRIGHIGGPPHVSSARDRLAGYRRALKRHGVPYRKDLVYPAPFTIEGGAEAADRLLNRADRPSAIFAATDLQAVGVFKVARACGLRIPEDLALVGGDDIDLAEFLEVPLTTFRQPARQIGVQAAELLIARLRGDKRPAQQTILQPTLIVRRSSGCQRTDR